MRLKPTDSAPRFSLTDIHGNRIAVPMTGRRVMLSFYRYASCPFCNLRIHELGKRAEAYRAQGLELIAVFQSSAEKITHYAGRQNSPFPIIADPERRLYKLYGLESSWRGMGVAFLRRPGEIARAFAKGFLPGSMEGEMHRLPADFIIDKEGILLGCYYGHDIGDHLPLPNLEAYLAQANDME